MGNRNKWDVVTLIMGDGDGKGLSADKDDADRPQYKKLSKREQEKINKAYTVFNNNQDAAQAERERKG